MSQSNTYNLTSPKSVLTPALYTEPKFLVAPVKLDTLSFTDNVYKSDTLVKAGSEPEYRFVKIVFTRTSATAVPANLKLSLTLENGHANVGNDDFDGAFNLIGAYTKTSNPAKDTDWYDRNPAGALIEYNKESVEITAESFIDTGVTNEKKAKFYCWFKVGNATTDPDENVGYDLRAVLTRANVEATEDMYDVEVFYQEFNRSELTSLKRTLGI